MDEAGTWHGGRPPPRRLCVTWGRRTRPQGRSPAPQFSAHFYCGQTAGCIKMPLGMEVSLSPIDFVLDGDPASPPLKGHSPQFLSNVRCGQTTGWMKTPLNWYGSRPWPRPHCIRRGPSSARKGHSSPPIFLAHVYCGHGRPGQLLLSSFWKKIICCGIKK